MIVTFCGSGHCFLNGKFDDLSGNTCTRFRGVPAATLFLERGCCFLSIRWPDRGKRKAENVSNILLLSLFWRNVRGEAVPFLTKGNRNNSPTVKGFWGWYNGTSFSRAPARLQGFRLRACNRVCGKQKKPGKGVSQTLGVLNWEVLRGRPLLFWSDPGRRHVRRLLGEKRASQEVPAKGDSEARNSLFVFLYSFFLSNLFLSLLSRGATACQCFFSPLTDKSGGLLRFC